MATRSLWSGTLSFGLVTFPVRLFSGQKEHKIPFRSVHQSDMLPLSQRMICPTHGEIDKSEVSRAWEREDGTMFEVTDEDFESNKPEKSSAIEITEFVNLADIDPAHFEQPYFLAPDKNTAANAYRLLAVALEETNKAGIAKVIIRTKEYLVAITARDGAIKMYSLRFADEVLQPEGFEIPSGKVNPKELELAKQMIGALEEPFDATKYKDEYRERVMQMLKDKEKGKKVRKPRIYKLKTETISLLDALKKSVSKPKSKPKRRG